MVVVVSFVVAVTSSVTGGAEVALQTKMDQHENDENKRRGTP